MGPSLSWFGCTISCGLCFLKHWYVSIGFKDLSCRSVIRQFFGPSPRKQWLTVYRGSQVMKRWEFHHLRPLDKAQWTVQKRFRCADAQWRLGNDSQSSTAPVRAAQLVEEVYNNVLVVPQPSGHFLNAWCSSVLCGRAVLLETIGFVMFRKLRLY